MKKIILGIALMTIGISAFAQQKINEGLITYSVSWNVPPQAQAMAASLPSELCVYFRGDSSSLKIESQMFSTQNILNLNKEYERILLDIPMMGKKLSVLFTPADQEKMAEVMPQMTLTPSTETKNILGFKASKFSVSETKTSANFDAWFTKDVEITGNPLSRFYDKSYGFPLEFTSFQNGMSLRATVKEIKTQTVPAGTFSATNDYEEITFDQLMQMGGRR